MEEKLRPFHHPSLDIGARFDLVGLGCAGELPGQREHAVIGAFLSVSPTSLVLTIANIVAVPLDDTWYWGLLIVYVSLLQDTLSRIPPILPLLCCYYPPWGGCLCCRIRCHP